MSGSINERSCIMNEENLKNEVKKYWEQKTCETKVTSKKKLTREYFDEIEQYTIIEKS